MLSINHRIPSFSLADPATTFTYSYTEERTQETIEEVYNKSDVLENKEDDIVIKDRILTYLRNELLVINVSDIALIYKENSITYVVSMNGQKSVSNYSLDSLTNELNDHHFFRVNRQIILSIFSIHKIIKMGNSFKITTQPASEIPIFVGKNKSLRFKTWLNGSCI